MKAKYESVPSPRNSFVVFRRSARSFPFHWHYHPEYELTFIEKGSGQRFVGDSIRDYGPGDLVLLGANLPHSWKSKEASPGDPTEHRAVVVQFLAEHLGHSLLDLDEMRPIAQLLANAARGLHFQLERLPSKLDGELVRLIDMPPARRTLSLLSILLTLAESPSASALSSGRVQPLARVAEEKRMNKICLFLQRNVENRINYPALAKQVHMEKSSLCRFFKRATGRTMTEYVNEVRVSNAARLLIETELSTLDIALAVGFSNYSNFCRQFRRFRGCNPRSIRQMLRAASSSPALK